LKNSHGILQSGKLPMKTPWDFSILVELTVDFNMVKW